MCEEKKEPPKPHLEPGDVFPSLVDVAIHSQENKLNLFSGFLFFQSILLLAWATIWQTCNAGRNAILFVMAVFGAAASIPWAFLGWDYADASDHFNAAAVDFEETYRLFDSGRPLAERLGKARKKWWKGRWLTRTANQFLRLCISNRTVVILSLLSMTHRRVGGFRTAT